MKTKVKYSLSLAHRSYWNLSEYNEDGGMIRNNNEVYTGGEPVVCVLFIYDTEDFSAAFDLLGVAMGVAPAQDGLKLVQGGTISSAHVDGEMRSDVAIDAFYIGETEVTQAVYESVIGYNPSEFEGDDLPVNCVNWYDAVIFCNCMSRLSGLERCYSMSDDSSIVCDFSKNGYRLPTEAEWEWAASGGVESEGYKYSGSNDIGEVAWYSFNSEYKIHSVGPIVDTF